MNKETEELILLGVGAFVLLSVLNGSSAGNSAKIAASQNTAYASDATSVINTLTNDLSD